ncbi:anthranilate synthase family protein [Streptomyces beihaiensis]|uniref:anthranilate synthase n=1 Tax=Streptomyces beihaiensis TaxID=2984495 RepID=A0ABT3U0S5_9ACTN|nr:anthranilate synthase family protein [Streptomyces beihaiensis]MCX3062914.1 anthranilate synthase family protein [Streptomyces beihaiensis]
MSTSHGQDSRSLSHARTPSDLLDRVLNRQAPAFALLHRPESGDPDAVDVLVGDVTLPKTLADIPLTDRTAPDAAATEHDVLIVAPYRQITERGFTAPDDGAPLIALSVADQDRVPVAELMARIPDAPTSVTARGFDIDDEQYAETVRRIVTDEIGTGEGANFVLKRTLLAEIDDYSLRDALVFFRRLLEREQGAYWTFVIHTGERTLVGATPERHISVSDGTAVMNPISGTYRYPPTGPTLEGVTEFLADRKETDELYMVVDEELKMMARVCEGGGRVLGPHLKEMARLAHTEYFIEGRTDRDVRAILHETLFAPTVTGSPLESAVRIIGKYEPQGRGYYSGVAALISRDTGTGRDLDSAILIRTADIEAHGRVRIGVGATLVRHSDPLSEVAETRAKASGLLGALESGQANRYGSHPDVRAALTRRNSGIAHFWLDDDEGRRPAVTGLEGMSALIIDAEDTFTAMIGLQLRSLGMRVTIRNYDDPYTFDGHDLVVMGPGPGDPEAADDPKIRSLRSAFECLLAGQRPFVAVCLSHQVLSLSLGLGLVRRGVPNQGVQREIDLFGGRERVGFYNTFAARCDEDKLDVDRVGAVEVSRDPVTGEVHALRGPGFASMQFHAESVLTVDGPRILGRTIQEVLGRAS